MEKLPLFLISGLFCGITIFAQAEMGAVRSLAQAPMGVRLSNSIMACALYLWKMVWPSDLSPIYPLRYDWPWWAVGGCGALLLGISSWAALEWRRRAHLLVGWCWYLVTLLPTLGLVQVGPQGMADRYTYVPLIGIFLAVVWEISERAESQIAKPALASAAAASVAACAVVTVVNTGYWHSSVELFAHATETAPNNYIAYRQLGMAFANNGAFPEAERNYRRSLAIKPDQAITHRCLGEVLVREGRDNAAFEPSSAALELRSEGRLHPRQVGGVAAEFTELRALQSQPGSGPGSIGLRTVSLWGPRSRGGARQGLRRA